MKDFFQQILTGQHLVQDHLSRAAHDQGLGVVPLMIFRRIGIGNQKSKERPGTVNSANPTAPARYTAKSAAANASGI